MFRKTAGKEKECRNAFEVCTMKTDRKIYYGWLVVVVCMIIQAVPFGVAKNTVSQFISYVTEGEGFSLASFGTVFMVGVLVSAAASPFIGRLFDRPNVNKRLLFLAGALMSGGGFILYSFCHTLPAFYGASAVVEVGTAVLSAIGVPVLINAWFQEKRGLALGLAFAGGGLGNIILQQIVPRILEERGYAYAYWILGLVSLIVAVPTVLLLIRFPQNIHAGVAMDGEAHGEPESGSAKQEGPRSKIKLWGYTPGDLLKTPVFWLFALAWFIVGLFVSGLAVQYMAYFVSIGFGTAMRANIGSIMAACTIIGNLFGGAIFQKIGEMKTLLLSFAIFVFSVICLLAAPVMPAFGYLFGVFHGLSVFLYIIGPSFLTGTLFGNRAYGTIVGIINIFFAFGYALGSVVFGLIAGNGTNYQGAWIYILICIVVCYVFLFGGTKYFQKKAGQMRIKTGEEGKRHE